MTINRRPIEIAPGLISDDTSFRIGQGGYVDLNNLRPWRNSMQTIGGWEAMSPDTLSGKCRGIHAWRDSDGVLNVAFGTHTNLYVWVGGDLFDITPADFVAGLADGTGGRGYGTGAYSTGLYSTPSDTDYFPLTWSLCNYGDNLIANARGQKIWRWQNDTAALAVAVPNAPVEVNYVTVTASRQVVAYGCNEEVGNAFNPRCIRFSDIEDVEQWTTATDNNAGEFILQNAGPIVGVKEVGAGHFIWTDEGLFSQQFVGSTNQTFRFTRLGRNTGLAGPNAMAVLGQQAFWMSPDLRFWTAGVGGSPLRLIAPLERDLSDNITPVQCDKIYAATVSEFGEIWWHYPDGRDGIENSRYISYSTSLDRWFSGVLDRTAWHDASPSPHVIGVDAAGVPYWHERGRSSNGGNIDWHAETGDITLSNANVGLQLRSMWPDFEDQQGPIRMSVLSRFNQRGQEQAHGPFTILPDTSKVNFRATGNIIRLRFEGSAAPAFCRMGTPTYDATRRGRR